MIAMRALPPGIARPMPALGVLDIAQVQLLAAHTARFAAPWRCVFADIRTASVIKVYP
jgi:hypothetical protein